MSILITVLVESSQLSIYIQQSPLGDKIEDWSPLGDKIEDWSVISIRPQSSSLDQGALGMQLSHHSISPFLTRHILYNLFTNFFFQIVSDSNSYWVSIFIPQMHH